MVEILDRLDLCMFQVCLWKINAFIFKQCDMNRLSINAKKDEKSPFPLENNELGMNFEQFEGAIESGPNSNTY